MNQKIKSREELRWIVNDLRQRGKKIVTTNGTFDILHTAHLRLLQKAKSLGDVLIVLINSDASVKKLREKKDRLLQKMKGLNTLLIYLQRIISLFLMKITH